MSNQKKATNLKDDYVIKGIYAEKNRSFPPLWSQMNFLWSRRQCTVAGTALEYARSGERLMVARALNKNKSKNIEILRIYGWKDFRSDICIVSVMENSPSNYGVTMS